MDASIDRTAVAAAAVTAKTVCGDAAVVVAVAAAAAAAVIAGGICNSADAVGRVATSIIDGGVGAAATVAQTVRGDGVVAVATMVTGSFRISVDDVGGSLAARIALIVVGNIARISTCTADRPILPPESHRPRYCPLYCCGLNLLE